MKNLYSRRNACPPPPPLPPDGIPRLRPLKGIKDNSLPYLTSIHSDVVQTPLDLVHSIQEYFLPDAVQTDLNPCLTICFVVETGKTVLAPSLCVCFVYSKTWRLDTGKTHVVSVLTIGYSVVDYALRYKQESNYCFIVIRIEYSCSYSYIEFIKLD